MSTFPLNSSVFYNKQRHLAAHVNELPEKWYTSDSEICRFADKNYKILITKDKDFRNSFFLHKTPRKLVRIVLGNISNNQLIELMETHLDAIQKLNKTEGFYLELGEFPTVYELK